jgi:EAL domain-containing protein (putative c-di-GMP-specific phosphodiesterase class I)
MVDFPLDKIKIARSLVEEKDTGIKERAIVRAIAALGASLGISTVVEGVTTPEHLSRIQMDGCSSIQGCLFSDAVSAEILKSRVEQLTKPNRTTTI